jgi:hypothetical protein
LRKWRKTIMWSHHYFDYRLNWIKSQNGCSKEIWYHSVTENSYALIISIQLNHGLMFELLIFEAFLIKTFLEKNKVLKDKFFYQWEKFSIMLLDFIDQLEVKYNFPWRIEIHLVFIKWYHKIFFEMIGVLVEE